MIKAMKRIVSGIDIDANGCWNWVKCVQSNGYGRVTYEYKSMGAHRLSYLAFKGEIPAKTDVCHSCDNRRCVNPAHLFLGSRKDNMNDCKKKNRIARGEMLPGAKLSDKDIIEIRAMNSNGIKTKYIAEIYGVHRVTIQNIITKKTWRHV